MDPTAGINIKDYFYELPDDRIAKRPLDNRDQSKLLVYKDGSISSLPFRSINEVLPVGNLLVRNNTRVIQARLIFRKETGAIIEVFCLEPLYPKSYELNFSAKGSVQWLCMIGNAKKWKSGKLTRNIEIGNSSLEISASKIEQRANHFLIEIEWNSNDISFADILENAGATPIPPYLNREAQKEDKEWYQTIYAQENGSVAAPTAGLHFTENVFKSLSKKNIEIEEVTLHVGAGTFRPVQSEKISDHIMHVESLIVDKQCIRSLLDQFRKGITAIGTTSLRTLESVYWLGKKLAAVPNLSSDQLNIEQWDAYQEDEEISSEESLRAILDYLNKRNLDQIQFSTGLIIVPGYQFRLVNRLITNFHQPGSTLLLLVAAFIGGDWRKVYKYALENDFRFLSYGDSSILELKK